MPRATLARLFAAMLVLTAVIAIPMTQIHWDGMQASTQAPKIDTLLNVMIVLSSFVLAIVLVMLGYCIWKYRAKPGDESDGEPIHGNTKLEVAWTVIPTVIVLFGAVYSAIVLADIEKTDPNALNMTVVAQQYKWTFEYPQPDGSTVVSDTMHVPVNRQLDLHLESLDVIHSFFVPEWRIKRDLVPDGPNGNHIDNTVVVTPDRLGTYTLECTELCGFGHATMRAFVYVQPKAQYESWLARQAAIEKNGGGPTGPEIPQHGTASSATSAPPSSGTTTTAGGA